VENAKLPGWSVYNSWMTEKGFDDNAVEWATAKTEFSAVS
jgi:hypothetical protein